MAEKCQGRLKTVGDCERQPSVVRDGRPYCWQHDPERRKRAAEQRRAEAARRAAEIDAEVESRRLALRAGVDKLSDDDLRTIVSLGGIRAMIEKLKEHQT